MPKPLPTTFSLRAVATLALMPALALLASCGGAGGSSSSTQVAAKVGSEEISIHQLNQVLARAPAPSTPAAADGMKRAALERLIDQQLAVGQAMDQELHRTPDVVAQIEAARREVLARAFAQAVASKVGKPTADEVRQYYASHPDLFVDRRVFTMQELVITAAPDSLLRDLQAHAGQHRSADDVAGVLRSRNIAFSPGMATRSADQIPLEILPRIAALRDGQSTVLDASGGLTYVQVLSSVRTPVTFEAAQPNIERFLLNERSGAAVTAQLKALREKTSVAYMGDFVPVAARAPTGTGTAAASAASTLGTAMDKGIAGLK